jgi:hypothetical protein
MFAEYGNLRKLDDSEVVYAGSSENKPAIFTKAVEIPYLERRFD